jgi:hypothetical protein
MMIFTSGFNAGTGILRLALPPYGGKVSQAPQGACCQLASTAGV